MKCARCKQKEGRHYLAYKYVEPLYEYYYCEDCHTPRLIQHFATINELDRRLFEEVLSWDERVEIQHKLQHEWANELAYLREFSPPKKDVE